MTSLRATAFASVRWTAAAMLARAALTLLQLVVLARLVPPEAFGVLAIALALQNIALGLSDLGLPTAIVHMPELSEDQKASLYWIATASGFALSLVLFLAAPAIGEFFGAPELVPVLALGCWVIFASALGSQFRALGEKRLQFGVLARIETLSAVLGFATTIAMAVAGFGILSVPVGALVSALVNSALAWVWLSAGWRPRLSVSLVLVRAHLGYGLQAMATGLANLLGQQADVLVAGRMVSTSALGYYFPAREIGMRAIFLLNPIVTRVGFPLIAHTRQDLLRVKEIYRQTVLMTASVSFPLYGALAVLASEIVLLALGETWFPTIPLLQVVAVWCALRAIGNPVGGLLFGMGLTRRALASSVIVTLLVLATVAAGAHFGGMAGVPLSLAGLYLALIPAMWFWLIRPACGLGFSQYHLQLARPALCTGLAMIAALAAKNATDIEIVRLGVGLISGGATYVLASALANREWLGAIGELLLVFPRKRLA